MQAQNFFKLVWKNKNMQIRKAAMEKHTSKKKKS